jgi:hypothetical protein
MSIVAPFMGVVVIHIVPYRVQTRVVLHYPLVFGVVCLMFGIVCPCFVGVREPAK